MLADVMEVIAAHWDDVMRHLSAAGQQTLIGYVRDFLASGDDARLDMALVVIDHVAPALPAGHPVRRAIANEGTRLEAGRSDWEVSVRMLRARLGPEDVGAAILGEAGIPGPEEIERAARAAILAAPTVTEAQVSACGTDPRDPGLIRLTGAGPDALFPAFQFDPQGRPRPVVTQINVMLDAAGDPWGVADWWLGENAWIGAVPAESIGRIGDRFLVAAARAVFEDA